MLNLRFTLVVLLAIKGIAGQSDYWNYKNHGPDEWPHVYEECRGRMQSPIDLDNEIAEYDNQLKDFSFNNYNQVLRWNLTNDGHTVKGEPLTDGDMPSIAGSDFNERFELLQFHLHWGFNKFQGSEHTLNGRKYPAEIHLVHQSASKKLAVIGFFFAVGPTNQNLDRFLNVFSNLQNKRDSIVATFNLLNIFPNFNDLRKNGYFRYIGSLTTPPCTEGLIWTVFRTPIIISRFQLNKIYSNTVEMNFREPQPLYGRKLGVSVRL